MILFTTKHEKGEYGYLAERKLQAILRLVLCIALGIGIFGISLLIPSERISKAFIVLSVLTVLPGAAALVSCVMVLPVKKISEEEKAFIDSIARKGDVILYDIVFTSKENRMHLDALFITGHQVIGFTSSRFDKPDIINRYFKNEFSKRRIDFVSFITNDRKALANRMELRGDKDEETGTKASKNVLEFVKVAIY